MSAVRSILGTLTQGDAAAAAAVRDTVAAGGDLRAPLIPGGPANVVLRYVCAFGHVEALRALAAAGLGARDLRAPSRGGGPPYAALRAGLRHPALAQEFAAWRLAPGELEAARPGGRTG